MITQSINLNLVPGGVLPRINISQYDKGSRTFNFHLFNESLEFEIPEGCSITIQGTKKDKTGFQYPCTYEGAWVFVDVTEQMSVLAGEVPAELVITDTNLNTLGTCNFVIDVESAALAQDTVISETDIPLMYQAIEAAAIANQAAGNAQQRVYDAEAWAQGTRNGVPVSSDDPAYHKNAKYFADNYIGYITDAQWVDIQTILST